MTVNELLCLSKMVRERLNELKSLRNTVSVRESYLYRDKERTSEPQVELKFIPFLRITYLKDEHKGEGFKMKQITISRFTGAGEVSRETWKELISALVLAGYEIYGDEERIVFTLGEDDKVEETEKDIEQ
jgi:hypothetical protein